MYIIDLIYIYIYIWYTMTVRYEYMYRATPNIYIICLFI